MKAARKDPEGTYLFILPWDLTHPGGVNQVVLNLYREVERSGFLTPLVLTLDWHSTIPREEVVAGCRTLRWRMRQPAGNSATVRELMSYVLTLPWTVLTLRRLIREHDVRIVNAQYPTLAALGFVVLKKLRLFRGPLFLSFHGMDVRRASETQGLTSLFWSWLARNADALIGCSDSLAREIRTLWPKLEQSPTSVRNGVDVQELFAEKASVPAGVDSLPQRRSILNVATFEHKKGQDVLVRAFARLVGDFPDVDLILIGGNGPERDKIKALIAELGLQSRVSCFTDMPHAQVLTYMEKATVFAFPSRYEPLGIAMLEAGLFGVPVVASDVDGIPEVINSNDMGILVRPDDIESFESALRKLLANETLRVALGNQLRNRVLTQFTWQGAWEQYAALLNSCRQAAPGVYANAELEKKYGS
jgi:glycosyltransferase involved in cell wall biosynthesis